MREIYVKPKQATIRFGCDYCKKTTARMATMEKHEARCYYNPDRICPYCDGSGRNVEWSEDGAYKICDDECEACEKARHALLLRKEHGV